MLEYRRKTLRSEVEFGGVGLHSGVPVVVKIKPGDQGIRFASGQEIVAARPENVIDTARCTRLSVASTIEHLMSAFCGLEITDADVELQGPELPGLDGSSAEYVRALLEAGLTDLDLVNKPELFRRIFLKENGVEISAAKGHGHWRFVFDAGDRWLGRQTYETELVIADYPEQIAPARTTAFAEEVEPARQMGLGLGLDETSVVVIGQTRYETPVRFPDEPARHKLLDLMGDLYLAGLPAAALAVVAERSGHRTNVKAAAMIVESLHQ
jgi:UDP-3-O-[3-hydroxymyristoyl] N-acetylglucosamine deacetylase